MFKFGPDDETRMLERLDELVRILRLPSRGNVIEVAVSRLWQAAKNCSGEPESIQLGDAAIGVADADVL